MAKVSRALDNPQTDCLNIFLNRLTETLENDKEWGGVSGSFLGMSELHLYDVDQTYLHYFLAYKYN